MRQFVVQGSRYLSFELGLVARESLQVALEEENAGRRLDTGDSECSLGPRGADEQPEQLGIERRRLVGQDRLGGKVLDDDRHLVEAASEFLGEQRLGAGDHLRHRIVGEPDG